MMANPLFQQMGGGQMPGQMGQFQQMMSAFQQFKQNFRGDPQQEVQRLLNTGQMTQDQYNRMQQMASYLSRMTGR